MLYALGASRAPLSSRAIATAPAASARASTIPLWGMLRRLSTLAVVLIVGLAPAGAVAAPSDVSTTHNYLAANYAFLHAVRASEHAANTNVAKLNRTLASECPSVGAGAPQNEEAQHMSYEVAGALWATLYHTDAKAVQAFIRAVRPLKWSNGKITHIAQAYVRSLSELATLASPDLCGDIRAWSADGFKAVPTATIQFDRHVEAIEGKSIPLHLLTPYEQPTDKDLAARAAHLETQLDDAETVVGFNDWDTLLQTLALNQ
jgi:hypothetical protein